MELIGYTQQETKEEHVIFFLAMPKYDLSLQDMIDRGGAYPHCNINPLETLPAYLEQALVALSVMHQHGYRHNDFKTANLLLRYPSSSPHLVLTDMGSVSPAVTTITCRQEALAIQETAAVHTTASYRSPELYDTPSQCVITPASDIWSFGVTVYNLIFSKTPFEHKDGVSTLAILSCTFTLPNSVEWPVAYTDIIHRCLCPMDQRATVNELLQLITSLPPPEYTIVSTSSSPVVVHQPATTSDTSQPPTTSENQSTTVPESISDVNFANFAEFSSSADDVATGMSGIAIDIPVVDENSQLAASFTDVSAVDALLAEQKSPSVHSKLLPEESSEQITQANNISASNDDGCVCDSDEFRDSDFGDFVAAERRNSSPPKPPMHVINTVSAAEQTEQSSVVVNDGDLRPVGIIDAEVIHAGPAFMMRRKKILVTSKLLRKQVVFVIFSSSVDTFRFT